MLAAAPNFFRKMSFDPINDFAHITTLNFSAFVLCVTADKPIHNIPELTAYLKKKGSSASNGSVAPTSVAFGETYKQRFGIDATNVNYKEKGQLLADLFNGALEFTCIDVITVAGFIKDGKLRPLAVSSAERLKSIPDIRGAAEAGIPGLDIKNWWSVHVPAKTPQAVCDTLERAFNEIAVDSNTLDFLRDNGSDPLPGNSKSLKALLIKDTETWKEYARIAHIEPI
jgi:tripartite-type tricarboxylate transporter receptor subunit TctC